jgi:hypothetical protein
MDARPGFQLATRTGPLPFRAHISGGIAAGIGEIKIAVGRIPFYTHVPFTSKLHLVGAIGGFDVRLEPFSLELDIRRLAIDGLIGHEDGMCCELKGSLDCNGVLDMEGQLFGKIARMAIELEDDCDDGCAQTIAAVQAKGQ